MIEAAAAGLRATRSDALALLDAFCAFGTFGAERLKPNEGVADKTDGKGLDRALPPPARSWTPDRLNSEPPAALVGAPKQDGDDTAPDIGMVLEDYLPYRTDETLAASRSGSHPAHLPLLAPHELRGIVAELTSEPVETDELDFERINRMMRSEGLLTNIPRLRRRRPIRGLTIIRDDGVGMAPFRPDAESLIRQFRRLIPAARFQVVPLRRKGAVNLARLSRIDAGRVILILSDCFAMARERGWSTASGSVWAALFGSAAAIDAKVCFLVPGDARTMEMPDPGSTFRYAVAKSATPIRFIPWDRATTARTVVRGLSRPAAWTPLRSPWISQADSTNEGYQRAEQNRAVRMLLSLLMRVSDGDPILLRAMRMVLAEPQVLASRAAWPVHIAPPPLWPAVKPVPGVSTLTEYRAWTEPLFARREGRWMFDIKGVREKLERARRIPGQADFSDLRWVETFAREVVVRLRAVLPAEILLADERLMADQTSELGNAAHGRLTVLKQQTRSSRLMDVFRLLDMRLGFAEPFTIDGKIRGAQRPTPVEIGFSFADGRLTVNETSRSPDAERRLTLWSRNRELSISVQVWSNNQLRLETTVPSLAFRCELPRQEPVLLPTQITLVIHEVAERRILTLGAQSTPGLAFRTSDTKPADYDPLNSVQFQGSVVSVGSAAYDSVALVRSVQASYRHKTFQEEEVGRPIEEFRRSRGAGDLAVCTTKDGFLVTSDPLAEDGSLISIQLTDYAEGERGAILALSSDAAAAVQSGKLFHVSRRNGEATITTYRIGSGWSLSEGACSRAGVLLSRPAGAGTDLLFLPAQTPVSATQAASLQLSGRTGSGAGIVPHAMEEQAATTEQIRYGRLLMHQDLIQSIAINERGEIAVLEHRGVLSLFEPLVELEPKKKFLSDFESQQVFAITFIDASLASWLRLDPNLDERQLEFTVFMTPAHWKTMTVVWKLFKRNATVPLNVVQRYLGHGPNATLVHQLLTEAVGHRVRSALLGGADPNLQLEVSTLTPLLLACLNPRCGHEVVALLLEAGALPELTDSFGKNPLYAAAFAEDGGGKLRELLNGGADPSRTWRYKGVDVGCLAPAVYPKGLEGTVPIELIYRLIDGGASFLVAGNSDGWACIESIVARGDIDLLDRALPELAKNPSGGCDLNAVLTSDFTLLMSAAFFDRPPMIGRLVAAGANPNGDAGAAPPLYVAAAMGRVECVRALLKHGADPNSGKRRPLAAVTARDFGSVDVSESAFDAVTDMLLDAGADIDPTNAPPLVDYISQWDTPDEAPASSIYRLLRRRSNRFAIVNTLAAAQKSLVLGENMRRLLALPNLDLEATNAAGQTVMHVAATLATRIKQGEQTTVDLLLTAGARADTIDKLGFLPLHYATVAAVEGAAHSLARVYPEGIEHVSADGLTPRDLASDTTIELPGLRSPSLLAGQVDDPFPEEIAQLTLIPMRTLNWRSELTPIRPELLVTFSRETMTINAHGRWLPAMSRSISLPYNEEIRLKEDWYRREGDGTAGLRAKVVNRVGDTILTINGQSPPIHELNKRATLVLDDEQSVLTYLVFFCSSVHGEDGPFKIIESEENIPLMGSGAVRVLDRIDFTKSVRYDPLDEKWSGSMPVFYGTTVFSCLIAVNRKGMCEMLHDEALVPDLPVRSLVSIKGMSYLV